MALWSAQAGRVLRRVYGLAGEGSLQGPKARPLRCAREAGAVGRPIGAESAPASVRPRSGRGYRPYRVPARAPWLRAHPLTQPNQRRSRAEAQRAAGSATATTEPAPPPTP